jgi:hypothetical protein
MYDLRVYGDLKSDHNDWTITLVPGAKIIVHLGTWREDHTVVLPEVRGVLDYYTEMCGRADEYRFTVVVFDDRASYATAVATIRPG